MLILSAGMQKSGSGWLFNLTNDLLVAAGHQDVRTLRARYRLHPILKYHNCNVGRPIGPKLLPLLLLHWMGNTFVVKTHSTPTPSVRKLSAGNILKTTYIYRDPRDVAISALDHGRELRQHGHSHSFARLHTLEDAILATREWLLIWDDWVNLPNTALFRYEDLVDNTIEELNRLVAFLDLEIQPQHMAEVIDTYSPAGGADLAARGLHFNQGVAGRFRRVMTSRELDFSSQAFGTYLARMGYEV